MDSAFHQHRSVSRRTWLAAMAVGSAAGMAHGSPANVHASTERWPYEQQLGSLRVHADFPLEPHATLLYEVRQLDQQLNRVLEVEAPSEPVHLILFRHKSTYQAYLRQYYPRVPYRRALYIKDRGPGIVFACRGPDLEIDVRHEATHALLHASQVHLPLWLDEGLAEYFEVPAEQRASGHEHLATARTYVRYSPATRLDDLEALDDLNDMGLPEYQRAWAWVHFCLHGSAEAKADLVRYVRDVTEHPAAMPLSDRLRRHWPDLEARFVQHFRVWS